MKILFCCIGDELFPGYTIDTNSNEIYSSLRHYGVEATRKIILRDNINDIVQGLSSNNDLFDIIICIGGLGPTFDDVTLEAVSRYTNKPIATDAKTENKIIARFKKAGITDESIINKNLRQARYIDSLFENATGLSIGSLIHLKDNKTMLLLPGPPHECLPMFMHHALPHLISKYSLRIKSVAKTLLLYNASESYIDSLIESLSLTTVKGIYAKGYYISLQFNASDKPAIQNDINKLLDLPNVYSSLCCLHDFPDLLSAMIHLKNIDMNHSYFSSAGFKTFIVGFLSGIFVRKNVFELKRNDAVILCDNIPLEFILAMLLKRFSHTVSVAESCTGGLVSSLLSSIAGISMHYKGSIIAYSNGVKEKIVGVASKTLKNHGAVSQETAYEMAYNIRTIMGSDIGISITGIAGPGGGSEEKPVGLVYIGISTKKNTEVFKHNFFGNRKTIQNASASFAFLHAILSFVIINSQLPVEKLFF